MSTNQETDSKCSVFKHFDKNLRNNLLYLSVSYGYNPQIWNRVSECVVKRESSKRVLKLDSNYSYEFGKYVSER